MSAVGAAILRVGGEGLCLRGKVKPNDPVMESILRHRLATWQLWLAHTSAHVYLVSRTCRDTSDPFPSRIMPLSQLYSDLPRSVIKN